jgi:hypothetical protein
MKKTTEQKLSDAILNSIDWEDYVHESRPWGIHVKDIHGDGSGGTYVLREYVARGKWTWFIRPDVEDYDGDGEEKYDSREAALAAAEADHREGVKRFLKKGKARA